LSSTKPFVAVDSDTLLYNSAIASESRYITVLHKPTGKTKDFSNRTEFKAVMREKGKVITEDYLIIDKQEAHPLANALSTAKLKAESILDNFDFHEVVFCAGDTNNFRRSLPYPTRYKSNREKTLRPLLLKDCHEYFKKKFKSVQAQGHECDDEVSILAYEALKQGREAFILSPDGDSRQFDGIKFGGYQDNPNECVNIQFMHEIKWDGKNLDTYGFPWIISQCAYGDATDGLNPQYLAQKKYGEKGFYNDFHKLNTPEEIVKKLVEKYKFWYPEPFEYTAWNGEKQRADWKSILELYWKGTTMKRERDKEPDIWEFLRQKGVSFDW
jgi:hypothetical protein